ncbi:MAG: peptidase [Gammaproteobacteria bacterium]
MFINKSRKTLIGLSSLAFLLFSGQSSAITITLNLLGGLSPTQEAIFTDAKNFWESILTGYRTSAVTIAGPTISAEGVAIDGVGGTLGTGGVDSLLNCSGLGFTCGGFYYTRTGSMQFDWADLANMESNGTLESSILHEMAHVLGFGTLWELNSVYVNGTGQYTGAAGLAAYQMEFDPFASFVPVELGCGPNTANSHWNEVNYGSGLTGITDSLGRDIRDELMTGWLNPSYFVSNTTLQQFVDIGYDVTVVPVPAAVWLFLSGLSLLGFRFRLV